MAAVLAAIAMFATVEPALAVAAPSTPFEQVALPPPQRHPHRLAYACMVSGAGLIGASFAFADHADRTYVRYLDSTEPAEIDRLFDETVRYDRLSSGSLIGGELLVAFGLYLRFLRRPTGRRLSLSLDARRCAVSYRF